jgi:MFS family permease
MAPTGWLLAGCWAVVYLWGLGGFTAASLACGLAPSAVWLVLARIVQGATAVLLASQVLTGIQLHFTGEARGRAGGWYAAVLAGSAVVSQVLGGLLISADLLGTGWRPVFLINVPLGAGLIALGARALPADEPRRPGGLDLPGVTVLSAGLALLVIPLVLGRDAGSSGAAGDPWSTSTCSPARRFPGGSSPPPSARARTSRCSSRSRSTSSRGSAIPRRFSGVALVSWVAAFGVAGLGLGAVFSGTLTQLTGAVAARHAADVSGLFNTASHVGGVIGVAAFGTLYLACGAREHPTRPFTVTVLALAATALAGAPGP